MSGSLGRLGRWLAARFHTLLDYPRLLRLYRKNDYLRAYSRHTDRRVVRDARDAIGGRWDKIGTLQFEFLVRHGLRPEHALLDIGCGTLRGGRHFIRHLDPGNYTGVDISEEAIRFGGALVEEEGLRDKRPRLLVSSDADLRFDALAGETFDVLLAQSVFTHLRPDHIEECLTHVSRLMHAESRFFFTFRPARRSRRVGVKTFRHPASLFEDLADALEYDLQHLEGYDHPRGQRMVVVSLRAGEP